MLAFCAPQRRTAHTLATQLFNVGMRGPTINVFYELTCRQSGSRLRRQTPPPSRVIAAGRKILAHDGLLGPWLANREQGHLEAISWQRIPPDDDGLSVAALA